MTVDDLPTELIQDSDSTKGTFGVYAENYNASQIFILCTTQFQQTESGLLGFNYSGVESALRLSGMTCSPEDFNKLRTMEIEAANAVNQRLRRR